MKRTTYSDEINFVTLTVVDWIDVFTKRIYNDFIIENLRYCQQYKGLIIYAYVIMTNHLHLVVDTEEGDVADVLRDFKTFTSKELFYMIQNNVQESKKEWMLNAFLKRGRENPLNSHHQFWQNGNYAVALFSTKVIDQKIHYIHENPVRAGFVDRQDKYLYSSANPNDPLEIDIHAL